MIVPIKKYSLIAAGILSLTLGVIGAFLPLLPTVPLVLLAAFCFARSSDRLHTWLINHQQFGYIIQNFEAGKGIPGRIKWRAIAMIWLSMGISGVIVDRWLLRVMLACIGLTVTVYLLRYPEPPEA